MPEKFNLDSNSENTDPEVVERENNKLRAMRAMMEIDDYLRLDEIIDPELYRELAGVKVRELRGKLSQLAENLALGLNPDYFKPEDRLKYLKALEILSFMDKEKLEDTLKGLLIYPETLLQIERKAKEEIKSRGLSGKLRNIFKKK